MLTRVLPPARPAATLGLATKLFIADYRQYWTPAALIDLAKLSKVR